MTEKLKLNSSTPKIRRNYNIMKILAIECSIETASAAITEDRELIGVYTKNAGRTHSEKLLPMIDELLRGYSLKIDDLDLLACTAGPGSFTGIRIGVSTIKGLAFSKNKPCIGISSLEALAYGFDNFPEECIIVPSIDARRGNVYNAVFSTKSGNHPDRLCSDRLISAVELAEELIKSNKKAVICGDGAKTIEKIIAEDKDRYINIVKAPPALLYPNAYAAALCALEKYSAGKYISDKDLSPIYLRPTQAERELCRSKE